MSSSTVSPPPLPPHVAGRKILPLPKRRLRSQSQPIRPLFDLSAFRGCDENSDSSSDEDSVNPTADWTDNTNNKKKRKIPTGSSFSSSSSCSMYHNDDRSSVLHTCHPSGLNALHGPFGIQKTRFKSAPVPYHRQPKKSFKPKTFPSINASDPSLTPPRGSFTFSWPAPGTHLPDYSDANVQTNANSNLHHPITPKQQPQRRRRRRRPPTCEEQPEFWVCQFCEYTAIFGQPPIQLERLYDIKEKRERQKIRQRKRLAAKSRLKRRGGGGGANTANSKMLDFSSSPTAIVEAPSPRDGYREVGVQTEGRSLLRKHVNSHLKVKMKSSTAQPGITTYPQVDPQPT